MIHHLFQRGRSSLSTGLASLVLTLAACQEPQVGRYALRDAAESSSHDVAASSFEGDVFDDKSGSTHPDSYTAVSFPDLSSSEESFFDKESPDSPVSCLEGVMEQQACDNLFSPCIGHQERFCVEGEWSSWSSCLDSYRIRAPLPLHQPVVNDYTIAALSKNGSSLGEKVYLIDIPSEEIIPLDSFYGSDLSLDGHFLSGVYSNVLPENTCQVLDLWYNAVINEGLCPQDLDSDIFVAIEDKTNLTVNSVLDKEELANLVTNVCISTPVVDYETVAFVSSPLLNGICAADESSLHVWYFIDKQLVTIPHVPGDIDKDPLLLDGLLLFSRYDSSNQVHLMQYHILNEEVTELLSESATLDTACEAGGVVSYAGWTQGAFNGATLAFRTNSQSDCQIVDGSCSCLDHVELRAYNLNTGAETIVRSVAAGNEVESPLGLPSLDQDYLVWEEKGVLRYCPLKEGW